MGLFILFALVLALSFWYWMMWLDKQEAIIMTPETVVKTFENTGYIIHDVRLVDEYPGPMEIPEYGLRFNMYSGDKEYSMLVALFDTRKKARRSAKQINDLDRKMDGGYAYSFYQGSILVQIFPSNSAFGRELSLVLKAAE